MINHDYTIMEIMDVHQNFLINSIDTLYLHDYRGSGLKVGKRISTPIIKKRVVSQQQRNRSPESPKIHSVKIQSSSSIGSTSTNNEDPFGVDENALITAQIVPQQGQHKNPVQNDSLLTICEEQINELEEYKRWNLRRALSVNSPEQQNGNAKKQGVQKHHEKKVVRFADALGLDLVTVKLISDLPPRVPRMAMDGLRGCRITTNDPTSVDNNSKKFKYYQDEFDDDFYDDEDDEDGGLIESYQRTPGLSNNRRTHPDLFQLSNMKFKWHKLFEQPGISPDFYKILNERNLSLENVYLKSNYLTGIVRVRNISYQKHVKLRYTIDNWTTSYDVNALYIENSSDGHTDRFSFNINLDINGMIGGDKNGPKANLTIDNDLVFNKMLTFEFALVYETHVHSEAFWDNNSGSNYKIELWHLIEQHTMDCNGTGGLAATDFETGLKNDTSAAFV
jgi:hypothetical protein